MDDVAVVKHGPDDLARRFFEDRAMLLSYVAERRARAEPTFEEIAARFAGAENERPDDWIEREQFRRYDEAVDSVLPGGRWSSVAEAAAWFRAERQRLRWSIDETAKRYSEVADYSTCRPGVRATPHQIGLLEADKLAVLPRWAFWMPLVFAYAEIAEEDRYLWRLENIPANSEANEILADLESGSSDEMAEMIAIFASLDLTIQRQVIEALRKIAA